MRRIIHKCDMCGKEVDQRDGCEKCRSPYIGMQITYMNKKFKWRVNNQDGSGLEFFTVDNHPYDKPSLLICRECFFKFKKLLKSKIEVYAKNWDINQELHKHE